MHCSSKKVFDILTVPLSKGFGDLNSDESCLISGIIYPLTQYIMSRSIFQLWFYQAQIKTGLWTPSCLLYSVVCSGWGEAAQPHSSWLLSATGTEHEVTPTKDSLLLTRILPRLISIKAICRACVDFMVQGAGTLSFGLISVFSGWNPCAFWFGSLC